MPTEMTPVMAVGGALFMLGGAMLVATYFVGSGLAVGPAGLRNLRTYLSQHSQARRRAWIGGAAAVIGAILCFGSVLAGDGERNGRCRSACREADFVTGRFRADPHAAFTPGDPYACWCQREDGGWSDRPAP